MIKIKADVEIERKNKLDVLKFMEYNKIHFDLFGMKIKQSKRQLEQTIRDMQAYSG